MPETVAQASAGVRHEQTEGIISNLRQGCWVGDRRIWRLRLSIVAGGRELTGDCVRRAML